MRNDKTRLALLSSILTGLCLLSGCARNSTPVVTPSQAVVLPGQTIQFTATLNGSPNTQVVWMVNGAMGGSQSTGTISSAGVYTTPANSAVQNVTVTAEIPADGVPSTPGFVQVFNPSKFTPGMVNSTNNPLVASYSIQAPEGAGVQIQFGQSTNYGLTTWAQSAPNFGGTVSIFVAGMQASTTYHMQATLSLPNGTQVTDTDHTFATGPLPSPPPSITVQQPGSTAPAPGVEMLCLDLLYGGNDLTGVVTDLSGNVIWYYDFGGVGLWPEPMKLLPNGHILMVVAPETNGTSVPPGVSTVNEVREIDLAGDIIYRLTLPEINAGLTSIGASFQALNLHHDILKLPNGHYILLVNYNETFADQAGLPPGTIVTGDALIDWDPQQGIPVWTWSAFDHLDVSRIPYGIANGVADWTHSNALVYTPDDGNIILSMRNQNWIIKINYENGSGDGSVLWHFGYQGDFTLPSGDSPIEWNYGQHYPTIVGPNSAGSFSMMFYNDGTNRLVNSSGAVCGSPGVISCYASVPIFNLNETTKTAQVQWEDNLSGSAYSVCCGDALVLSNGDVEFDVGDNLFTPGVSFVQEATQEQSPQVVWQMNIQNQLAYRAFRIPSLYPGIQWSQAALAAQTTADSRLRAQRTAPSQKH